MATILRDANSLGAISEFSHVCSALLNYVDGTDGPSAAADPPPYGRETEGGCHRPSDVRRQAQESEAFECDGGSLESWKGVAIRGGESLGALREVLFARWA